MKTRFFELFCNSAICKSCETSHTYIPIVRSDAVEKLKHAVETAYPRSHPDFADKFAVHSCKIVDGVKEWKMGSNP